MSIRLANAEFARIPRRKIVNYVLASAHPAGRAKAVFFGRFGFTAEAWTALRDALLDHARSGSVVSISDSRFGRKYTLEGPLATPDGRTPLVRSVWYIETGEQNPRFVTAYPASGARR